MSYQNFKQLILECFIEKNEEKAMEACKQLYELKNTDIRVGLKRCAQIMTTINVNKTLRVAAIELVTNYIRHSDFQCPPFDRVNPHIQQLITRRCQNLNSDFVSEIKQFIAQIYIDTEEEAIPIYIWNKIIKYIIETYERRQNPNQEINLFTVIHISEMLICHNQIGYDQIQVILDKNYKGIQSINKTKVIVQTLKEAISMIRIYFDDNRIRNNLWILLSSQLTTNNQQNKEIALLTINKFVKLTTKHLSQYIGELYEKTIQLFAGISEADPAIQIWVDVAFDLADVQRRRLTQQQKQTKQLLFQIFTEKSRQFLVPLIKNLVVENEGPRGDGEQIPLLSRRQSSYLLIGLIQDMIREPSHQPLLVFIDNMIRGQGAHHRKGACLAFQAIAEGCPTDLTKRIINAKIIGFVQLLGDEISLVRTAACDAIEIVSKKYSDILLNGPNSVDILHLLVNNLKSQDSKLIAPVKVIKFMTSKMRNFQGSFILQQKNELLNELLLVINRRDISSEHMDVIEYAYMGIQNILPSIENPATLKQHLIYFVVSLYNTFSLVDDQNIYQQSGLANCIHDCLSRLDSVDLSEQEIEEIVKFLESDKLGKRDQLYLISGLAKCLKQQITRYSIKFLYFINLSLQDSDTDIFSVALLSLSDVAAQMGAQFAPHKDVLEFLTEQIMCTTVSRELKLTIYDTITNIIVSLQQESIFYIPNFKVVLFQGISGCIFLQRINEAKLIEYADKLKECLINFYQYPLHTFHEQKAHLDLSDTIPQIINFIQFVCDKKYEPSDKFCCQCIFVVFDIANFYYLIEPIRTQIEDFIKSQFILDILKVLNSYLDNETFTEAVKYACDVLKIRYNYQVDLQQ